MKFQVGRLVCELSLDNDGRVQTQWYLGNGRRTEAPKYLCARERRQYRAGRDAFLGAAGKLRARVRNDMSVRTVIIGSALALTVTTAGAQVVLYKENLTNPTSVGSAAWRIEQAAPGPGQKPDIVVGAEIVIPEQNVAFRLSVRRNDDKSLPASHMVEITFTLPPDSPHGGISNIPGILMTYGGMSQGMPLGAVPVKVMPNSFLIGLSSVDAADMQRNIEFLKERPWFDIPVIYGDGKRAIIAVEKGPPGERAFAEAFAIWGQ